MKKVIIFSSLVIALCSCGGDSSSESNAVTSDTGNLTNPSAMDTTKHPDGMINGSVISTDTAAMNTQNSINKAKQAKNK